eukprot:TRINITY_DN800_c0_g1_i1.p1 TRINITY_DN800_c0_g1~~TRINITY_DN800_c0_g1_i1.p1  ORF type:complete len:707 (+),score=188.16 TRINITY_DN800_c0_g1_i1:62-2182(+)
MDEVKQVAVEAGAVGLVAFAVLSAIKSQWKSSQLESLRQHFPPDLLVCGSAGGVEAKQDALAAQGQQMIFGEVEVVDVNGFVHTWDPRFNNSKTEEEMQPNAYNEARECLENLRLYFKAKDSTYNGFKGIIGRVIYEYIVKHFFRQIVGGSDLRAKLSKRVEDLISLFRHIKEKNLLKSKTFSKGESFRGVIDKMHSLMHRLQKKLEIEPDKTTRELLAECKELCALLGEECENMGIQLLVSSGVSQICTNGEVKAWAIEGKVNERNESGKTMMKWCKDKPEASGLLQIMLQFLNSKSLARRAACLMILDSERNCFGSSSGEDSKEDVVNEISSFFEVLNDRYAALVGILKTDVAKELVFRARNSIAMAASFKEVSKMLAGIMCVMESHGSQGLENAAALKCFCLRELQVLQMLVQERFDKHYKALRTLKGNPDLTKPPRGLQVMQIEFLQQKCSALDSSLAKILARLASAPESRVEVEETQKFLAGLPDREFLLGILQAVLNGTLVELGGQTNKSTTTLKATDLPPHAFAPLLSEEKDLHIETRKSSRSNSSSSAVLVPQSSFRTMMKEVEFYRCSTYYRQTFREFQNVLAKHGHPNFSTALPASLKDSLIDLFILDDECSVLYKIWKEALAGPHLNVLLVYAVGDSSGLSSLSRISTELEKHCRSSGSVKIVDLLEEINLRGQRYEIQSSVKDTGLSEELWRIL